MIKTCTDQYGFGCTVSADLTDLADVSSKFRLVEGKYYRGPCKKCEALNQKVYRKNKGNETFYEPRDYGNAQNLSSGEGSWIS